MAPTLTGTCLSLEEAKAAWGNLQSKLISLPSQHTVDTWLQRIDDWNITFGVISRYRYFRQCDLCHQTNTINYKKKGANLHCVPFWELREMISLSNISAGQTHQPSIKTDHSE